MLSKRILWLTCAAVAGWLVWMRLRQRQDDFATSTPQFAPPRTFALPSVPPAAPAHPPQQSEAPVAAPAPDLPAADTPQGSAPGANRVADLAEAGDTTEAEVSGYCMRCKTKRPIQNAHRETTESGRPAARGTCPVCGANMFTFLPTNDDA